MRRADDAGVATVIGAVMILAILGIALVYVNAYHVPRQGRALEVAAAERAELSFTTLAATLSASDGAPLAHDVPLRAGRPTPPLLAGIVLTPVRAEGTLSLERGPNITLSATVPAPAEGVPVADPMRENLSNGRMRVYLLGNATAGHPVGSLRAATGGAYDSGMAHRLEAGAVLSERQGTSESVAPPGLSIERGAGRHAVAWRLPLLSGSRAEVSGAGAAQAVFVPGPQASLGGGTAVFDVRVRIETDAVTAWQAAMESVIGAKGIVNVTRTTGDAGVVEAVILPPAGTAASTRAVELSLWTVRYQVSLADRAGG